jgi:uncharacterized protein (TIGR02145 family)
VHGFLAIAINTSGVSCISNSYTVYIDGASQPADPIVYDTVLSGTIRGRVTDSSGAAGLSGALVRLEHAGKETISDADGNFSIDAGTTGIRGHSGKASQQSPAVTVRNGLLSVPIDKMSSVVVSVCDLKGTTISTARKTLAPGEHFLSMPQNPTGIYVCKVRINGREVVLKGSTIAGAAGGRCTATGLGHRKTVSAKRAKSASVQSDVLTAEKSGYLKYRATVNYSNAAELAVTMIPSAGTLTDADGNVYQTVKIGNQQWMAENLRTTSYADGTPIPFDTSSVAWAKATSPKYCYYGNTTNQDTITAFGALYNRYVIMSSNSRKIAPPGWHLPTDEEWDVLQNYLIANGYNADGTRSDNKVAKSMASRADWVSGSMDGMIGADLSKNNRCGFSGLPGGYRFTYGNFGGIGLYGNWWSATEGAETFSWIHYLFYGRPELFKGGGDNYTGYSIRFVKD